jgi:hypothetical protein
MLAILSIQKTARALVSGSLICFALFVYWGTNSAVRLSQATPPDLEEPKLTGLPCLNLQGAKDTLVVFRTGSTEIDDRILVHLSTSLRCFSQYLIFSDFEEQYHGEYIIDALSSVSDEIKASHDDFETIAGHEKQRRRFASA